MACIFQNLDARGIVTAADPDHPIRIEVSGLVISDDPPCTEVKATLSLGGSSTVTGEVSADGSFSVSFIAGQHYSSQDVRCGASLKIDVECSEGGDECPSESVPVPALACEPDIPTECPDMAILVLLDEDGNSVDEGDISDDCIPSGTYHFHVDEPAGSLYVWSIDGADFETTPASSPTSPPFMVSAGGEAVAVSVSVLVASIPNCLVPATRVLEPCDEPPQPCPDVIALTLLDAADQPVDLDVLPEGCLPAGMYRFRVDEPSASENNYAWSIEGAGFEAAPTSDPLSPFFEVTEGGEVISVSVAVNVAGAVDCLLLDVDTLVPCPPSLDECPDTLRIELVLDDDEEPECLPPGRYVLRVVEPDPAGISFSWSRDGISISTSLDPVNYPLNGPELLFDIESGETAEFSVATLPAPHCDLLSDAITIEACSCPGPFTLRVIDSEGMEVDPSECVVPGTYVVEVVDPEGSADYMWYVDGQEQAGVTGSSFSIDLGAGEEVGVMAEVPETDTCPLRQARVVLQACECPTAPTLTVLDSDRNPATDCVTPGDFVVVVSGEDVAAENVTWNVDGVTVQDATEVPITVTGGDAVMCGGGPAGPLVTATVGYDRTDCPDGVVSTVLNICQSARFCVLCWLLRLALLFFAILTTIGAALWMCPQVVLNPLIPQTASLVPVAAAVAPWVTLIAAAVTVVILIIWIIFCNPTPCNDWWVLLWQFMVGAGFVFAYFGACPTCGTLPLGLGMMFIGVVAFFVWVMRCRPSPCKIFFEIGNLGLVQLILGWVEFFLVVCIWAYGWLLQLLFTMLLNAAGWIGSVIACKLNPNAS